MENFLGDSHIIRYVILPLLIFVSRIFDVSLGTLRIIFVSRGRKFLAPLLGFFEVLIWILAIGQIMQQLDNFITYIAYAGGFAAGNFVGLLLEEKLAMGIYIVRIILNRDECKLRQCMVNEGFGLTTVDGMGAQGPVKIIYTVIRRRNLKKVVDIIKGCNSKAFYSIEDARASYYGVFPNSSRNVHGARVFGSLVRRARLLKAFRKRK